ncbi:5-(carboxyamino)imidazole ribonucleotide synthase, partial [bacterium]|nr:5-(carboxyamino)imidazole ribonucleotide synthase [bacterium]
MVKKIGILGGGQLARMLVLRAHEIGVKAYVLSPSVQDPAAQVTAHWEQGNPNRENDVLQFLKKVDVLTFESEFTSSDVLKILVKSKNVFPRAAIMSVLQNRSSQKELMMEHQIPTSP